jgi:hypothetical protein
MARLVYLRGLTGQTPVPSKVSKWLLLLRHKRRYTSELSHATECTMERELRCRCKRLARMDGAATPCLDKISEVEKNRCEVKIPCPEATTKRQKVVAPPS